MTDDRSARRSPDGGNDAGGDRVRRNLRSVVDHRDHAPDAWAIIRQRVESGETGAIITGTTPASTARAGRRVLVAAVALVALVGGAVATRFVTNEDRAASVTTGSPVEPTGWYVPVGLPAGWHPLTVEVHRAVEACPCRETTWSDASGTRSIFLRSTGTLGGDTMPEDSPGVPVDLGPGSKAFLGGGNSPGGSPGLIWEVGGRTAILTTTGLSADEVLSVGRALVADPLTAGVPVEDVERQSDRRGQAFLDAHSSVVVTYRAPSGHRVNYRLSLPDSPITRMGVERFKVTHLEDQPMPVLLIDRYRFVGYDYTNYIGRWPGATAAGNGSVGVLRDGSPNVTPDEAVTLLAALRPVTTAQWRNMIVEARDPAVIGPPDPRLWTATSLAALLAG